MRRIIDQVEIEAYRPVEVLTQIKNRDLVGRRRKQLVEAAKKVFFEKGYHKTGIRDIAKASSFSMGNLYDYIRRKEDILYLVYQDMINSIYGNILDIKDEVANCEDLISIIRNAAMKAYEFQEEILLLYRESGSLNKEMLRPILNLETSYIERFKRLLDEVNGKGFCKIRDTKFLAGLIVYLFSFFSMRRWSLRNYQKEEQVNLLMYYIARMLEPVERKSGSRERKKVNRGKRGQASKGKKR
jgi:AcrR family transcriptional regulator